MKASYYNYFAKLENGKNILFNFLTNSMMEVKEEELPEVQHILEHCNDELTGSRAEMRQLLEQRMYLVPDDADELQIIRIKNLSKRYDNLVYSLVLMPTLDCNFSCKYCFESHYKGFMSEQVKRGVINWAEKIARVSKRLTIDWFGGEPMLDFSIIEEINGAVKQVCAKYNCFFVSAITTNGSLFTDEILRKIDDLRIANFQITVDGTPEFHNKYRPYRDGSGTFDVVFQNIFRILRETKANVAMRINVDCENIESATTLLDMIPTEYRTPRLLIAFKDIFSDPGGQTGKEEEITKRRVTYKEMKKLYFYAVQQGFNVFMPAFRIQDHHCASGDKNYFIVHPSGDLYRCTVEFETGQKVGELLEDGNLRLDSFATARWIGYVPGDDERCAKCQFLPMCHGGCRYNRMMGKKPCLLESADLNGVIELYYLSQTIAKR